MSASPTHSMNLARLRELLDTYGAELSHLPQTEQQAARHLIAHSEQAAQLHAEARALDLLLDAAPTEPVSPALRARVAEIPILHPSAQRDWWAGFLSWRGALRVAAAGLLAAALGAASASLSTGDEAAMASDDGWDDVTTLAFAAGIEESP
jgi:hypothetical protein